jgi:hypothetical protein
MWVSQRFGQDPALATGFVCGRNPVYWLPELFDKAIISISTIEIYNHYPGYDFD